MNIHGKRSQRWEAATEAEHAVWQPILLITPERLECRCGAKAIFLCVAVDEQGDICDGESFCQACYEKDEREEEEEE